MSSLLNGPAVPAQIIESDPFYTTKDIKKKRNT